MNPTLVYIRASALTWWSYRSWKCGDKNVRAYHMKLNMRDIVMAGALFRVERQKELNLR